MSEQDNTTASIEDSATSGTQDAAIPEVQANGEIQDTAPVKNEDASQSTEQPIDSKLEKAQNAARDANIKLRKRDREIAQMRAAQNQGSTQPVQPQATPEADVPEDILYDQDKQVAFYDARQKSAIEKDRKEQDEIRQANTTQQEEETFWSKSDELAVSDPEYAELVESSDDVQMSKILTDTLKRSKFGAKLHKHVLSNPDVLLKINSLSIQYPAAAKKALSDIEASFSNNNSGQQSKPNITNAPPVIDTANTGSGPIASSANAGGMKDYYAKRMAEKAARG